MGFRGAGCSKNIWGLRNHLGVLGNGVVGGLHSTVPLPVLPANTPAGGKGAMAELLPQAGRVWKGMGWNNEQEVSTFLS